MSDVKEKKETATRRKPKRPEQWHLVLLRSVAGKPICCEMGVTMDGLKMGHSEAARLLKKAGDLKEAFVVAGTREVIETKLSDARKALDAYTAWCGPHVEERIGFDARPGSGSGR